MSDGTNMTSHDGRPLDYLQALVNTVGGVVWEFDWSTGSFTFVTEAAERLLGFPIDQWLMPGFWLERLHPDDRDWAPTFCMDTTKLGRDHEFEYRMIHADGHEVCRDIVTVDPVRRMDGALRGLLIDITGQKLAERLLASSELRFRRMVENVGLFAMQLEPDGVIAYAAPAFEALFGTPETPAAGRPLGELLSEEQAAELEAYREQHGLPIPTGGAVLRLVSNTGDVRTTRWHVATLA
ncbi:MAG: PAS domain S-box protein, partial [Actinobacteria bacterium]